MEEEEEVWEESLPSVKGSYTTQAAGPTLEDPTPAKLPRTHINLFTALLLFQSAPVSVLQSLYSLAHVALPDRQVNLCDIT